jgi:probable rRNA maturation factor
MKAGGPARRKRAIALTVQVATRSRHLPARAHLRRWARASLKRPAEVTFRIVGEREGEGLNRSFRSQHHATNVLTFCYEAGDRICGDIVLCAPVIAREARAQGKSLQAHYAHLAVHGLLHLQGYDHLVSSEARTMETREIAILRRLGYPNPYLTAANR